MVGAEEMIVLAVAKIGKSNGRDVVFDIRQ